MEAPKENVTVINYFPDIANYVPNLSGYMPNFQHVNSVHIYNMVSDVYGAVPNVSGSLSNGLKQVIQTVTDKKEIKDMIKLLNENDPEMIKLVADAFFEKICSLKKETHLTYDCNVICLKACVTFSEVNMAGKIYKYAHNSCHTNEEALSIATILRNYEIRKQILNKCSNNNDAKAGLVHLLCGHNGEAKEILSKMLIELLKK